MLSAIAAGHVHSPRNVGPLDTASHVGRVGVPGDGPHMTLWFQVDGEQITRAAYATYGCPSAIACASMTAQILIGRTVSRALSLTPHDLDVLLGGLPEGKGECAVMAIESIRNALGGNPS